MLYSPSKDLTFIVYQDHNATKCYRISKGQLKFLLIVTPLILVACLFFTVITVSYFKNIKRAIESKRPVMLEKLQTNIDNLESENTKLQNNNDDLLERLKTKVPSKSILPALFSDPVGSKDLRSDKKIEFKIQKLKRSNNNITFSFGLNNLSQSKTSGHIFVFMRSSNGLKFYPAKKITNSWDSISYHEGETFTMSRYRPVKVEFALKKSVKEAYLDVVVFSRKGDLLLTQTEHFMDQ